MSWASLSEGLDAEARSTLGSQLLRLYFAAIIGLHRVAPRLATTVSARPEASALARWQASRQRWVTDQWHRVASLDDEERAAIVQLDGTSSDVDPALVARLCRRGLLVG